MKFITFKKGVYQGYGFKKGHIPWNKDKNVSITTGRHLSEETKRKISVALKGREITKEWRHNLSEAGKGRIPWNKGKKNPYSKETIEIMTLHHRTKRGFKSSFYGKHLSEEHRKKISEALTGKYVGAKHPRWLGGVSFLPYSPDFNRRLKEQIKTRDNFTCQFCESKYDLVVHHIDYDKMNNVPENIITLCRSCNGKVNVNRDYWTNYFNTNITVHYS